MEEDDEESKRETHINPRFHGKEKKNIQKMTT